MKVYRNFEAAGEYILQATDLVLTSHHRPEYTPEERQQVADWMNGKDRPLPTMVTRQNDPRDPVTQRGLWPD